MRQNPHVRICGGPGSATTLVYPTNLKQDMPGEIRRIAAFLDIPIDERQWEAILEHCSFDYMKVNATKSVPLGGIFWDGGAQQFIFKG